MVLVELGKAFYNDPKGTMVTIANLLGEEAADTIVKATQCGAYDLGNVIGSYVSPAFALKMASRLTKYAGKLEDVAKVLKREYGCASFGAGTLVATPDGMVPIERIAVGQAVLSRSEANFRDRAQPVTEIFGRVAPSYRVLTTESEQFNVTDEHPLWVQGKGWTEARSVAVDDVIASEQGDALVTANDAVQQPLRVYNFSVAKTTSYFVGKVGLWAHNSVCSIAVFTKTWDKLSKAERGFLGEWKVFDELRTKGYTPVGNSFNPLGKTPDEALKLWDGQKGIDGLVQGREGKLRHCGIQIDGRYQQIRSVGLCRQAVHDTRRTPNERGLDRSTAGQIRSGWR